MSHSKYWSSLSITLLKSKLESKMFKIVDMEIYALCNLEIVIFYFHGIAGLLNSFRFSKKREKMRLTVAVERVRFWTCTGIIRRGLLLSYGWQNITQFTYSDHKSCDPTRDQINCHKCVLCVEMSKSIKKEELLLVNLICVSCLTFGQLIWLFGNPLNYSKVRCDQYDQ